MQPSDILDEFGILAREYKKKNITLDNSEKVVYASLSLEPAHVSEVASETGLGIPDVMDCLLSLEMKGLIDTVGNNYYAIKI